MARPPRKLPLLAVLTCAALAPACRRPPAPLPVAVPKPVVPPMVHQPVPPAELPLFAPRAFQPLALDGALTESIWRAAAHSGPFADEQTGQPAVPHSELRLADDGERLLLGLYAADEDIVAKAKQTDPLDPADDAFIVHIQHPGGTAPYELYVSANGTIRETAAAPAATAQHLAASSCAVELDGSLNNPDDDDEEWVVECIVPLARLGAHIGDTLEFAVKRCDTPKNAARRCGVWRRRVQIQ